MKMLPTFLATAVCSALMLFSGTIPCAIAEPADQVHTPEKGSGERTAILDALRGEYTTGSGSAVKFLVRHFKVHRGWAWINVVPLDKGGNPEGEEWPSLLHQENGKWVTIDLVAIAGPDDPVGPTDPSSQYLRRLQKKYPQMPSDIFPKASR